MTVVAPTNTTRETAYVISLVPDTLTEDMSSEPSEVWFAYTAPADKAALGLLAYSDTLSAVYRPYVYVYRSDWSPVTPIITAGVVEPYLTRSVVVPLVEGVTYYIKVWRAGSGSLSGVTLTVSLQYPPSESISAGDLLINDDTSDLPLVVLDQTDGHVKRYINPFPAGEYGDSLSTGFYLFDSILENTVLKLYDGTFSLVDSVGGVVSADDSGEPFISGGYASKFYVVQHPGVGFGVVYTVTTTGTVGAKTWTLPEDDSGMGVSPDETILYYLNFTDGQWHIRRYDLATETLLSDLATNPVSYTIQTHADIKVMQDGSVLVPWNTSIFPEVGLVKRYSPSGEELNTYDVGLCVQHIALDPDPDYFWIWAFDSTDIHAFFPWKDTFYKIRASDGSIVASLVDLPEIEEGKGDQWATTDPELFGHSNSCPFLIAQSGISPPSASLSPSASPSASLSASPSAASIPINPYVMLQFSDDGGQTWSNEYWRPVGRVGEHRKRLIWRQLGRARDRIFRIAVSDPCKWVFLDAHIDAEIGTGRR